MTQHVRSPRSGPYIDQVDASGPQWIEIRPVFDSVPHTRHLVCGLLAPAEPDFIDNAELVTCELVTNAIRCVRTLSAPPYGVDPAVLLAVERHPRWVHLRVRDPYPQALPVRRQPDATDTSGRGLLISEAVADHFWVEVGHAYKTVHAVLAEQGVVLSEEEIARLRG
jgi:hypothetical protein